MQTYKIAISTMSLAGKIPPGSDLWHRFNASFVNREIDIFTLGDRIYNGHAFTTWHKDWRKRDNYICGQHLGLDFDGTYTLDALVKEPFIASHSALVYTTPSHTPENPRLRAVFLLDKEIVQPMNYTLAANALI